MLYYLHYFLLHINNLSLKKKKKKKNLTILMMEILLLFLDKQLQT